MNKDDKQTIHVLFVDDDEDSYFIIRRLLGETGNSYKIHYANTYEEGLLEIVKDNYDICLLDYRLGPHTGIDFINNAAADYSKIPIILLTGQGDKDVDIIAMKAGASDYLDKGKLEAPILERSIRYAIERKKSEEQIKYLAYYDQLTGLPNRILFIDRLKVAISAASRYNRSFSVMFIDIDNFKLINDTLGHSIGDRLIVEVAKRLLYSVRKNDTPGRNIVCPDLDTVARMGGDEFIILLSEINEYENASKVAERIRISLRSPIKLGDTSISITISIGIAIYPADGKDIDTIIKHADVAMYTAKSLGKNTFQYFSPDMNTAARKRLAIENELHKAIINKQFVVYYQPIVETKSKRINVLEALVRWQHPQKGIILPGDFIPLAEENGMILEIGEQVLHTIGAHYQKWNNLDMNEVEIAINISPKQLQHNNFITTLRNVIEEYRIKPSLLSLEITENSIIHNIQVVNDVIRAIRNLGIRLVLDDFGSGYSSFVVLKQILFDIIKIDRSFISQIPGNKADATITSSIISIGHSMDLKVVAEGIETESQFSFLEANSCDMLQGFYFYYPMEEEEIVNLLTRSNT